MKMYIILFLAVGLLTMHIQANAHNTGRHEAAEGGPCWIWEIPGEPIYCLFVHGTRHDHPNPVVKVDPIYD